MVEEQAGQRRDGWHAPLWLKIFNGFRVAIDPKKLLLGGAGLLVMACGWWVLAWFFSLFRTEPQWSAYETKDPAKEEQAWNHFKADRRNYNIFYEMAAERPSSPKEARRWDIYDLSNTLQDYQALEQLQTKSVEELQALAAANPLAAKALLLKTNETGIKPAGRLRTLPWFEYRGPNPYLLLTGNVAGPDGSRARFWQSGAFFNWFASDQVPVLLEPLIKFMLPLVYAFRTNSFWNFVYLVLIILWNLVTWAIFGAAITRMAAVQVARHNEKIGLMEALRFARSRFMSFFSAPLFPLICLAFITICLVIYGLVEGYTWFFGDIVVAGIFYPLVLIAGLVMAVVLVGLVGWPMMYSTISSEGSDAFDALSRSYSYVYQAPWHYLWYSVVAVAYGAVLVFFVTFMGSLLVYVGKWGIMEAPLLANREPTYLFQYAPTSFGWRDLLLYGNADVTTTPTVLPSGAVVPSYTLNPNAKYTQDISINNKVGAVMVSIWLYLAFLVMVGFGYSYFWTAATIIYLLMRRKVDDTDLDEIHLEEEDEEPLLPEAPAPASTIGEVPGVAKPVMVEAPTLRTPPVEVVAAPPPSSAAPEPAAPPTDGPAGPTASS